MSQDDAISRQRSQLPATKQAWLEKRLQRKQKAAPASQTIPRRPPQEHAPQSFAQQRLWFLDELIPQSPGYNVTRTIRLSGPLDAAALEQSFNEIVRRHEILRTTFADVNGQPVQIISEQLTVTWQWADLSGLAEAERETRAQQLADQEARRPFDLQRGPLLRMRLLRLDDQEHLLILVLHHIVFDGWSVDVLLKELSALYAAFSEGQTSPQAGRKQSPLPELPLQYADFAVWQREWLQGKTLETQLAYWKRQLGGELPILELPADHPRPSFQNYGGALQSFTLPRPLSEALRALSQQQESTLFMTLLAAFKTLLHRYTGQTDVLIGTPIANRNRAEIEGLIGFFVNTLVLRTDLAGNPTFRELLGRVRQVTLQAYDQQDLPFEKLLEELQPERDLSRNPLFQVMFAFQNVSPQRLALPGLSTQLSQVHHRMAQFDLTLHIEDTPQEIRGTWEYSTDLFEPDTIARLSGHFQTLLNDVVTQGPDRRLSDLSIMTQAERAQLLVDWNDTTSDYALARQGCIHQLFEAQAARTPGAVAVTCQDRQLTYQELNQQANQMAHHLQALGVGPETPVAICVERSIEMVVGLLGILKAGGAYVPLDPDYPKERLAFMLKDSQASVLLTQGRLLQNLPEGETKQVCLDTDWEIVARENKTNPNSGATPDNPVYVIYTSGSTGRPKGVTVSHQALAQYAASAIDHFAVTPDDKVLQFASVSFDAAAEEIFCCLLGGATLVLRSDDMLDSVETFVQTCAIKGITVLDLPTAYWHTMMAELKTKPLPFPPSLRLLIIGGEAALPERLETWRARAPQHIRLLNTYGPTEATIVATTCDLAATERARIPIGKPVANAQVFLLDTRLQPLPVGVPGELHIGGAGLARGYHNRPALTAQAFIPHPFPLPERDEKKRGRLYKTGDLARYLPDGNIEFLGRIDQQVKVRGFRIELGEIETVLREHPQVQETVVVAADQADGDSPADKRLVAYVVATDQGSALDLSSPANELRRHLKQKLPDYMLPAHFVTLEALPLTPSGKIDRRALPALDGARPELKDVFVAPRTPIEETLAKIWTEILGLERIGVHDNFFELGGHSLLATRLTSRLRDVFQIELPLIEFFDMPTVAELAENIEAIHWVARSPQADPATKKDARVEGEL